MAERYLRAKGYRLLERNFRAPVGEIDIIVLEGETIVFVEVKTNETQEFGAPQERVHRKKQRQIIKTAWVYLKQKQMTNADFRFDVVGIDLSNSSHEQIEHIENAFNGNEFNESSY